MTPTQAETAVLKALVELGRPGAMFNVMKAIGDYTTDYETGFALANEMQNKDWIKIIYGSFTQNLVNVELTLIGQQEWERRSKK